VAGGPAGWIDVHAHFTTPEYVEAASASGHAQPDGMRGYPSWSVEDHLRLLDDNGIDLAVLSMSSPGVHFGDDDQARALARAVNDVAAAAAEQHPDRFAFFASLPLPDVEASVDELTRSMDELGAKGVIVETNAQGVYLGDPVMEPVYAELARRRGILFIHPTSPACSEATSLGRPRPMIEFMFDTARAVTDLILAGVLDRHPDMPVIVPHAGGVLPLLADRIQGFMSIFGDPDQPKPDVHGALARMYYDLAGDPFPRLVPSLLTIVPRDHVLYGTDYCWTPAPGVAKRLSLIEADSPAWKDTTTTAARALLDAAGKDLHAR
jgi:predicted TIM-barrel fold metal-dependent hydrolase